MEVESIRIRDRLGMRGMKNKGLLEISQDPKTDTFVIVMSKGIRKKWLFFNFPEGMWRAKCSREEVMAVVGNFMEEKVLAD